MVEAAAQLEEALAKIKAQTAYIEELLNDNQSLKQQLAKTEVRATSPADPDTSRKRPRSNSLGTTDAADLKGLLELAQDQIEQLDARYKSLLYDHTRHLQLFDRVQQKYKDAKRYCQEWRRWYNSCKRPASLAAASIPEDRSLIDTPDNTDLPIDSSTGMNDREISSSLEIKAEEEDTPRQAKDVHHPSSQTTDSEQNDSAATNQTSSPIVISTRVVGKKRPASPTCHPSSVRIKLEYGSQPISISDDSSRRCSSPRPTDDLQVPLFHQASDLEVAQTLATPRKHRRQGQHRSGAPHQTSNQRERQSAKVSPTAVPPLQDGVAHELRKTKVANGYESSTEKSSYTRTQASSNQVSRVALQPLSPNSIAPSLKVEHKNGLLRKYEIANVAEDGEHDGEDDGASANRHHQPFKAASLSPSADTRHQRLARLVSRPDGTDANAPADFTPDNRARQIRHSFKTDQPGDPSLTFSDKALDTRAVITPDQPRTSVSHRASPRSGRRPANSHVRHAIDEARISASAQRGAKSSSTNPVTKTSAEPTPLRSRRLDSLSLGDFKINPSHAGSDFAFAETVRGREARRCLEGCTNPDCCGTTFLRAVEMSSGDGKTATTSTVSEDELLESYLGPDSRIVMQTLAAEERDQLLLRARARAFANQFGKHRHVFARRRTPPGYWRTDMPSTQELAEDRARSAMMERDEVQSRWIEALRPDGRWSFRDE